jgi:putative sterol carrier protein/putative NADPH-quinone reductase
MKILSFNGSPRGKHSNTDRILQPFLEGAREAGAETETIYLKDLEIKPCLGCFTCWTKTPGVCVQKDDMAPLLEKMRLADITVYATPLYIFTVSGLTKNFMDRSLPLIDPHIVKRGEHYGHPRRYEEMPKRRVVLISNCGFPERDNFSGLVETFHRFTDDPDSELMATILCPMGELLGQPALQDSFRWYYEAVRNAGREVVELGHITPETQAILDRELVPMEVFVSMANAYWDSQIVAPKDEKETVEPGRPLSLPATAPTTMRDMIAGMPFAFNAQVAGDLLATIQFDVSGEEPGQYYLQIAEGRCVAFEGKHPSSMLIIHTPSEVWMAISRGELDGTQAMMQGKYSIEGDLNLLMRFNELFSGADADER